MEGAAENGLGLAHAMLSEFEPALGHMRRAAELQSALPWAYDAAESRANVCWITQEEGRLEAARDCFDETLPEIRNLGSLDLLATVQNNLAGVSAGLGDPDSALAWLHATLPLRERIGQPKGIGEVHNNLAFVYRRVGEIQRALDEYIAAIPWRRAANDTRGLGSPTTTSGSCPGDRRPRARQGLARARTQLLAGCPGPRERGAHRAEPRKCSAFARYRGREPRPLQEGTRALARAVRSGRRMPRAHSPGAEPA
jgi:tetratricopeptide (TPR) repeat protein